MLKVKGKKTWKDWTVEDVMTKLPFELTEEELEYTKEFISKHLSVFKAEVEVRIKTNNTLSGDKCLLEHIEAAYSNCEIVPVGNTEDPEEPEDNDVDPSTDDEDQEIIEVSQAEVKKALKALLIKQDKILAWLYAHHEEYNKAYFNGWLSTPVITIEKLSNKTLGDYNPGTDNTGLNNHIRMNKNFIALNTETRILETLRHEMIHQYQDEVLYEKKDSKGNILSPGGKRPKEWHNVEFKDWANKVSIPANGKHCTGNPAHMPEAKSYNRKFACGCVATNGYPLTVWSTREVHAMCTVCGRPFIELKKSGGTIEVKLSAIEQSGTDAIEAKMLETFNSFEKSKGKVEHATFLQDIKDKGFEYQEGIYQKGHLAYQQGYKYWVAWTDPEAIIATIEPEVPVGTPDEPKDLETPVVTTEEAKEPAKVDPPKDDKPKRGRKKKTIDIDNDPDIVAPKSHRKPKEDESKTQEPTEGEEPKKKRGRPAGTKNKVKGENENDTGNVAEKA